jgi:hypothetical protein
LWADLRATPPSLGRCASRQRASPEPDEAKQQVQEIAVKVIERAPRAKTLTHINQITMEQAKHRTTQG